jgi:hypothetical protein
VRHRSQPIHRPCNASPDRNARLFLRISRSSRKECGTMELLIVLLVMVVFGLVAMRWGYDSTESVNSPEWEKRLAAPFVGYS